MSSPPVGREQCNVICPTCRQQIRTEIKYKSSTKTHILAVLLCVIGCIPCACCLYCTGCARNTEHYCPSCHGFIGVYDK